MAVSWVDGGAACARQELIRAAGVILFRGCGGCRERARQLVLNKLLKDGAVSAHEPTAVDEHRRGIGYLEGLPFLDVGQNDGGSFGASHAEAKVLRIEPSLLGEVPHLFPDVFRRDDFLAIEDQVVQLPERVRILRKGASAGKGGGHRPGVDLG